MRRVGLFAFVGLMFLLLWLERDANFQDPESAADWFVVLGFSVTLIALAFALPMFAQLVSGRFVFRVSLVPAVGAGLGGSANFLEDGLQLS